MVGKAIQALICLSCKTMTWVTAQAVFLSMKPPTWIASREEHQLPMALYDTVYCSCIDLFFLLMLEFVRNFFAFILLLLLSSLKVLPVIFSVYTVPNVSFLCIPKPKKFFFC
jgi:hypothetical protein